MIATTILAMALASPPGIKPFYGAPVYTATQACELRGFETWGKTYTYAENPQGTFVKVSIANCRNVDQWTMDGRPFGWPPDRYVVDLDGFYITCKINSLVVEYGHPVAYGYCDQQQVVAELGYVAPEKTK